MPNERLMASSTHPPKVHKTQNNTPKAGRIFWCYGPGQGSITIIGLEPHPDDKGNSYKKVTLSSMGQKME